MFHYCASHPCPICHPPACPCCGRAYWGYWQRPYLPPPTPITCYGVGSAVARAQSILAA